MSIRDALRQHTEQPSAASRPKATVGPRFGLAVFAVSLGLLLMRFLVPRPVGLADNSDGPRLLCQLGVAWDSPTWVRRDFVRFNYGAGIPCEDGYVSSQLWLDRFAQWLGRLFDVSDGLSLLVLGAISCVIASLGVTLIALAVPLPRWGRVTVAALVWLIVADAAFFGYFASVFSEASGFLGLLLIVGGILLLHRENRWALPVGAVATLVGGLLAVNSKMQTLLIALPLAVVLIFWRPSVMTARRRMIRWSVSLVLLAIIGGGTIATQLPGDPGAGKYREINAYNAIFVNIVDGGHDTQGDLAALGLPPSFSKYALTHWWSEPAAHQDPEYPKYQDRVTMRNVARYYVTHPGRTLQILDHGAKEMLRARLPYLGSYGQQSGQPRLAQEYRVALFSLGTEAVAFLGLYFLVPLWILVGLLGFRVMRARHVTGAYELGLVVLFLITSAAAQFGVAVLAEGIEHTKHTTIALFCTLLACPLVFMGLLLRRPVTRRDREAEPTPAVAREQHPVIPRDQQG